MKIITPELDNPIMKAAFQALPDLEPIAAPGLISSTKMLESGKADSMILCASSAKKQVKF